MARGFRLKNRAQLRAGAALKAVRKQEPEFAGACKNGVRPPAQLAGLKMQSVEKTGCCASWYDSCSKEATDHFRLLTGPHYNAFN
jgi:hypothetical protein